VRVTKELTKELRAVAAKMQGVCLRMRECGNASDQEQGKLLLQHANEMQGAADVCIDWAENLEAGEVGGIPSSWSNKLRHMLGAGPERPKKDHGFRNYYCTSVGSDSYNVLRDMEKSGLVTAGSFINGGRDQYFHATVEGCKAIGLSNAAIKRVFED
jgi:hypothetical protein